jgi:hypothetical protein
MWSDVPSGRRRLYSHVVDKIRCLHVKLRPRDTFTNSTTAGGQGGTTNNSAPGTAGQGPGGAVFAYNGVFSQASNIVTPPSISPGVNEFDLVGVSAPAVPPSVTAPASQNAVEGASQSFNLGSFSDSSSGPWNVDVNWNDGTPHTTYSVITAGSLGTQSHIYAEEGTSSSPTVTVTNSSTNLSGSITFQVTVADAVLTATATPVATAVYATPFSGEVATFGDANPNAALSDFPLANVTIQWGDGNTSHAKAITQPGGVGTAFHVFGANTYGQAGATANPLHMTIADVGGAISNTTSYTLTIGKAGSTVMVTVTSL